MERFGTLNASLYSASVLILFFSENVFTFCFTCRFWTQKTFFITGKWYDACKCQPHPTHILFSVSKSILKHLVKTHSEQFSLKVSCSNTSEWITELSGFKTKIQLKWKRVVLIQNGLMLDCSSYVGIWVERRLTPP